MTPKQRAFVLEYIKDFNATQAAIRAGYSPKYAGTNCDKLLKNTKISAAIDEEFQKRAMSANEVLSRMGDIARGTADDYLTIDKYGYAGLDLQKMKEAGKLHLIKKYSNTKNGVVLELYDAQAALVQMGKQHGLFPNRQELTGKDGEPVRVKVIDYGLDDDTD
jgi:phage terminase small subunit